MAENSQVVVEINPGMEKLAEKEERKIPVFTVQKNSSILKNIYLIDSPPPPPGPSSFSSSSSNLVEKESHVTDKQEFEETLVVGRHPDCNITLEHPSISRFHLRIHSVPSRKSLSVIDLSSVHGTWVCGKKIEPGVPVELQDGDVLQLGGSSRIYKLHWIPLSHAYDYDNPFVPMIKGPDTVEEKEETQQDVEKLSLQHDHQIHMEADDMLCTSKNMRSKIKQLTPSAPPMPEDMESPFSSEEEAENKPHLECTKQQPTWVQDEEGLSLQHGKRKIEHDLDGLDLLFSDMTAVTEKASLSTSDSLLHEDMESPLSFDEEAENKNSRCLSEIADLKPVLQFHGENNIADVAIDSGNSTHESSESPTLRPQLSSGMSIWNRRGKSAGVYVSVQTSRGRESCNKMNGVDFEVKLESHEKNNVELVPEAPFACEDTVNEVFTPDKENYTSNPLFNKSQKKLGQEKAKHELSVDSMISSINENKEEAFTPDKENITPNTLLCKRLDDIRYPKTYRSSPLKNASSGVHQEVDKLGSSSKGNHVNKLLQEKKPGRSALTLLKTQADRIPFQPLLKSPYRSGPETTKSKAAINSCSPIKNKKIKEPIHPLHNLHEIPKEQNNNWTMVVDAGCLLNKDSRKALQLMQGLQGTSLIIPRIVIRELDCMKRRGNLFRRKAEIFSALEWIEQCLVNAQSWIHVQSSLEDVRPIATTPPATPLFTHEVEKTQKLPISSVPFSPFGGSWLDVLSPTTEDHILECALFFRRIKSNGQLVLLSNDVTLKIKAMAEGLLCETAEEFRQSLVNPFSERFLWTDSSPRGPTWSCVDDVVLREQYYNNPPIKKQSKSGEATKGLKLILHHNSHFRQISSVR